MPRVAVLLAPLLVAVLVAASTAAAQTNVELQEGLAQFNQCALASAAPITQSRIPPPPPVPTAASGPARWTEAPPQPRAPGEDSARVVSGPRSFSWFNETVEIISPYGVCTGVLLSHDTVLTAAHCVCNLRLADTSIPPAIVWLGALTDRVGSRTFAASELPPQNAYPIEHRNTRLYDSGFCASLAQSNPAAMAGRDLALLRISYVRADALKKELKDGRPVLKPTPDRTITPAIIGLPRLYLSPALNNLVVVGYGTGPDGKTGVKRHACVSITSRMCGFASQQDRYGCSAGREMVLSDVSGQRRDTCNGDSGGPVFALIRSGPVFFYYLVGITSRGTNGGACGQGGIYTLLTPAAVQWIQSQGVVLRSYPYPDQ